MKYHLVVVCLFLEAAVVCGQGSIINGNFENWVLSTYNYPQNYPKTSNIEAYLKHMSSFNVIRTSDRFHGSYAVRLSTLATTKDTASAFLINVSRDGDILSNLGIPYTQNPAGLRGYYKYSSPASDSGLIITAFWKGGSIVDSYFFKLGGPHNTYSLFNFNYKPKLPGPPDSIILGFTSSNIIRNKPVPGSTLYLDSLSFTGVNSQPLLLNGDFESWLNETLYTLSGWYSDFKGVTRTRDSYIGTYAAEIKTYKGYESNIPSAIPGLISNGKYSTSCNCITGGVPYNSKKDTLTFYYKYVPAAPSDNGQVSMTFKKNGMPIGGSTLQLRASSVYKNIEIPFNLPAVPDTVLINIQSSLPGNKALVFSGSSLKIDQLSFKSLEFTTAIEGKRKEIDLRIYPNPGTGRFTIELLDDTFSMATLQIAIYSVTGQMIIKDRIRELKTDFDISSYPDGVYIVNLYDGQSVYTAKIIKI